MSINATLNLDEASRRRWDVITIGAGPAGSVTARELSKQGAKVLLVDRARFPRWKVCGCCLNLCAQATLTNIGLSRLAERCGAKPLDHLLLAAQGWHARIPVDGHALSREVFDAALVEAAIHAGAHFLPETQARLGNLSLQARTIHLRQTGQETEASAAVILGANGLGGNLLTEAGTHRRQVEAGSRLGAGVVAREAPKDYVAGVISMACGQGGYVGLVRLEDDRLDIAAAFDADFVKQADGLGKAAAAILHEGGLPPIPGIETLPWHGTPLLTGHAPVPGAERLFLLGDAAGYVEPFTGEGMAWALASGVAVTPLVLRACRSWEPSLLEQWSLIYRQTITRRQWVCRLAANLLRHPTLMRFAVAALGRFPALASPWLNYLNQDSALAKNAVATAQLASP